MSNVVTSLPITNGIYRLRSIDRGSCLELPKALQHPHGRVTAKPHANTFDQIWFFYHTGEHKYQIVSASAPGIWLGAEFTRNEDGIDAFPVGKPTATEWTIRPGDTRGLKFYTILEYDMEACINMSSAGIVTLFQPNDNTRQLWEVVAASASSQTIGMFASSLSRLTIPGADGGYRPSIRTDGHVTPSFGPTTAIDGGSRSSILTTGCYRVRNLNPSCVLTLSPPDKVYVDQQDGWMRLAQAWEFLRHDNGYYSIRARNTSRYLSYYMDHEIHQPVIQVRDTLAEWSLESVGGFGWIIGVPQTNYAIGFADYRADPTDKITLVDNIRAHCQIWVCESYRDLGKDARVRDTISSRSRATSTYGGFRGD